MLLEIDTPKSDLKIGGFELYGVVYSNNVLIHTKCICRERLSNAVLFMIIIIRESK